MIATNQVSPLEMAVDPGHVYWTNVDDHVTGDLTPPGTIMRANLDGGEVVKLADEPEEPDDIAIDDLFLYWGSAGGTIARVPKEGGDTEILHSYVYQIFSVVVDQHYLYATNPIPGALLRIALDAPDEVEIVQNVGHPLNVIQDGSDLLISEGYRIKKASKADLSPIMIYDAKEDESLMEMAVDSERVYFATSYPASDCAEWGKSSR